MISPRLAILAVGLGLLATAARGQQPGGPVPGDVDRAASRVYVFVGKTGLGHNHAVAGNVLSGRIRLDAAEEAGTLVFDMRSFRADTAEARRALGLEGETDAGTQQQVNDNMLGPAVLDVQKHPTATFQIRSSLRSPRAGARGQPVYDLTGTFTLHGVSRPITIPVEFEPLAGSIRLRGGFSIRQTDFGMKPYTKLGGVVGVADELKIYGDIRCLAAAQEPAR